MISSLIQAIKSLLFREGRPILLLLLIILAALSFGGIKSCSDHKKANDQLRGWFHQNLQTVESKANERVELAYTKAEQNLILKDIVIQKLTDSLDISRKNIKEIKRITLQKTITKTLVEYDTVYEFIELSGLPAKFNEKLDDCLSVKGEFTPEGLKITAKRSLEIYDINYFKRRRLLGLKWTPRIGRKEHYQTLVTNCGDTITENQRILFTKPPQ